MPTGVYLRTEEYREKQRIAMSKRINPGKNKTEETKRKIGDSQRGIPKSDEFKEKCRIRMTGGISPMKGKKQSEKQRKMMRDRGGKNHYNYKDGMSRDTRTTVLKRQGMTEEDYRILFDFQNGVCAICKKPEIMKKNLSIDHDHRCCDGKKACGKCVRGLLCSSCNTALGFFNDDIFILESAKKYLSRTA